MIDGILSGEIYQILEKSMNASSLQHTAITNNISNVDTPGYKRSEVVFQSKLEQVLYGRGKEYMPLALTHKNHIDIFPRLTINEIKPEIIANNEMSSRQDGNNVDIDAEMAKLAQNTAYYSTIAGLVSLKLSSLQDVIHDGRR
ncbi:MAG TPA: flagellar basal body rod protein FlgB [bacterium]|nr:flagellar basal body rod protein FlgB [bacterium]